MGLTPMMNQYLEIKENYKDCILFFRLGDFYEMFFEDAEVASKELELVLTGRDCGLEKRAPMCGIPYHASNSYIGRLVSKGYKVAICEQVEDPAASKGIVKRDVIKIVTPGTYNDSNFIDESKNNYIMCIYLDENSKKASISTTDISTGEFFNTCFEFRGNLVYDEISKFSPNEIIISSNADSDFIKELMLYTSALITRRCVDYFKIIEEDLLFSHFGEEVRELDDTSGGSAYALLKYVIETQKMALSNINHIEIYDIVDYMIIDANSRRNLELVENIREKTKKGSLLWVLDRAQTSMGSRQLRKWIEQPLISRKEIEKRLEAVEELYNNPFVLEEIREALKEIYDIERIIGKISNKNVNGKDMVSLKISLNKIPKIKETLKACNSSLLSYYFNEIDEMEDIKNLLENSILDDPSITLKEGNIIKDGYSDEVDQLRGAKLHGKEWIAALENQEREFTGIRSLKVGYNKVFGYYIEISKANYSSIPEGRYIRKQTLANAERFITQQLKEMEDKILGAEEKLTTLEYDLFVEIRGAVEEQISRMQKTAKFISELDCLTSFALIALENNYIKPIISEGDVINIKDGRHPVVEKVIPRGEFVSNATNLDNIENQLLIITGPNMAGKSTYMRQVALITLMAQIGSFIPASYAEVSICDKIFTRIGASDDLAGGKSTFMVEMWEVANILKNATKNSLVLLDEVGRGTSTYDGLSIAWSVIEYLCNNQNMRCKTLFATHYHELTRLEEEIKGVKNYSVAVKEVENSILFLRKIVEGGADQSYGIEVAKLAGLPEEVINRAKEILKNLEDNSVYSSKSEIIKDSNTTNQPVKEAAITEEQVAIENSAPKVNKKNIEENVQLDFLSLSKENLIKSIANLDILSITPIEAINKLYELTKQAKDLI
ncbi:DNA mismatch repair protein MutS [Clostridium polyendosporum]|uniref:DNA mismatch repair protein MutS n=1 Tax=Clostridium polyendosporum TaxID=69208 RepID=A0A919VNL4_9CLOT|nr:DNA mismatch repair protein MutS [Clostridium polyendosporum]GIM30648.1 DNA mismatch repair protein MutS [Clostridium polyendosporum]